MEPTSGTSTTAPRGDGAQTAAQPAPDSANPAVTHAPRAGDAFAYGKDGGKSYPSEADRSSYAWRFGALAMEARLFLLGRTPLADFVRIVNAGHADTSLPPIPEDVPKFLRRFRRENPDVNRLECHEAALEIAMDALKKIMDSDWREPEAWRASHAIVDIKALFVKRGVSR